MRTTTTKMPTEYPPKSDDDDGVNYEGDGKDGDDIILDSRHLDDLGLNVRDKIRSEADGYRYYRRDRNRMTMKKQYSSDLRTYPPIRRRFLGLRRQDGRRR